MKISFWIWKRDFVVFVVATFKFEFRISIFYIKKMFRCQLSNEFGLGHLSGEEVLHRAVVITEKQRAFEPTLSCGGVTSRLACGMMMGSP